MRRVLEYIAAGDVFQVNLSQRFTARGRHDPLDLYLRLKEQSPAAVRGIPPLERPGGRVGQPGVVLPDARRHRWSPGRSRVRGHGASDPEDDGRLAAELLASPKDRAELTMIVDLERNDLGRVCEYGSVVVRDPLSIESFAQVHHLVATVEGRLRPGTGPVDVIRALFPGGSITGAPKIRAMEIIDELEPNRREPLHRRDRLPEPGRIERLQHRDPHHPGRRRSCELSGRRRYRGRFRSRGRIRGDTGQGQGDACRARSQRGDEHPSGLST